VLIDRLKLEFPSQGIEDDDTVLGVVRVELRAAAGVGDVVELADEIRPAALR
jgi:hypothetical protein